MDSLYYVTIDETYYFVFFKYLWVCFCVSEGEFKWRMAYNFQEKYQSETFIKCCFQTSIYRTRTQSEISRICSCFAKNNYDKNFSIIVPVPTFEESEEHICWIGFLFRPILQHSGLSEFLLISYLHPVGRVHQCSNLRTI